MTRQIVWELVEENGKRKLVKAEGSTSQKPERTVAPVVKKPAKTPKVEAVQTAAAPTPSREELEGTETKVTFSKGRKGPEVKSIKGLKGFPEKGFKPNPGETWIVCLHLHKHGGSWCLEPVSQFDDQKKGA